MFRLLVLQTLQQPTSWRIEESAWLEISEGYYNEMLNVAAVG
jgi:hypothetical protein